MTPARREILAGLLMVVMGLSIAYLGTSYRIGTSTSMGPGYFPTALGVIMAILGVLIAVSGSSATATDAEEGAGHSSFGVPDLRGAVCIIGGVLAFLGFGAYAGLVPATLACVFISALGDRTMSVLGAFSLAVGLTGFTIALFVYGLQVQFPLWTL